MTSWRKRKSISYSFFHKGIDLIGHLDSQQNPGFCQEIGMHILRCFVIGYPPESGKEYA